MIELCQFTQKNLKEEVMRFLPSLPEDASHLSREILVLLCTNYYHNFMEDLDQKLDQRDQKIFEEIIEKLKTGGGAVLELSCLVPPWVLYELNKLENKIFAVKAKEGDYYAFRNFYIQF